MNRDIMEYDGTDIPVVYRHRMNSSIEHKKGRERIHKAMIATMSFWLDMYKKRLEKYKKLKNSLIDIHDIEKK